MKTHTIQTIFAALLLTIPATTSLANLSGSDDFNDNSKDLTKWGADSGGAGHSLNEINQRLEYTADGSDSFKERPWILSTGSYVENWEARMDVHLSTAALPVDGDDRRFTLGLSAGGFSAGVQLELKNYSGTTLRSFKVGDDGPGGTDSLVSTLSTDGAVRVTFDASTKILGFYYDENGSIGGYTWTQFDTIDTDAVGTDWGLNAASTFAIAPFGESEGVGVSSGEAYGDNFNVVPEPPDPILPTVVIRPAAQIAWSSVVGQTYIVQASASMAAGSWQTVHGPVAGTGVEMTYCERTDTSTRFFYRVTTQ